MQGKSGRKRSMHFMPEIVESTDKYVKELHNQFGSYVRIYKGSALDAYKRSAPEAATAELVTEELSDASTEANPFGLSDSADILKSTKDLILDGIVHKRQQDSVLVRSPLAPPGYHPDTFLYSHPNAKIDVPTAVDMFRRANPEFERRCADAELISGDGSSTEAAAMFAKRFGEELDRFEASARDTSSGALIDDGNPANCRSMCRKRDQIISECGFGDIFETVKREESARAIGLLNRVLSDLDAVDPNAVRSPERLAAAFQNVLAGNIFDLGAAASADAFSGEGGLDFQSVREQLSPRSEWLADDLDRIVSRILQKPPLKKVMLFCDNAGVDVVLGMVPLARELLRIGTGEVILVANTVPSVNDITAAELGDMLPILSDMDPENSLLPQAVRNGRLRVVGSGSDLPVLDLRQVSPELAAESADADFVIIEGMGRSIETNLYQPLTVDSVRVGMVKHPEVAEALGGKLYDCIVSYLPGTGLEMSLADAENSERFM
jgi:type II pantothenate kinase